MRCMGPGYILMRMWMCNPSFMCTQHLLGEHVECHMFAGTLNRKLSMQGYIENNLFEPKSLRTRHDALAVEIEKRGGVHSSPLQDFAISYLPPEQQIATINRETALHELLRRCPRCRQHYEAQHGKENS